jgi:hypothetical protein
MDDVGIMSQMLLFYTYILQKRQQESELAEEREREAEREIAAERDRVANHNALMLTLTAALAMFEEEIGRRRGGKASVYVIHKRPWHRIHLCGPHCDIFLIILITLSARSSQADRVCCVLIIIERPRTDRFKSLSSARELPGKLLPGTLAFHIDTEAAQAANPCEHGCIHPLSERSWLSHGGRYEGASTTGLDNTKYESNL